MFVLVALVWQLMKAYTLSILTKLAGQDAGHPIVEREIVAWANEKVCKRHSVCCISLSLFNIYRQLLQVALNYSPVSDVNMEIVTNVWYFYVYV